LIGHGTVESPDDLAPFLANIRRGRPVAPELLAEVRRRYEAIGGSPLLARSRAQAAALEAELGWPVHLAMRFWHPYVPDVVAEAARAGARELVVVPLAPWSASLYVAAARQAAEQLAAAGGPALALRGTGNWGLEPSLVRGFAEVLARALARVPAERRDAAHVVLTAHSLPLAVTRAGDPYERELRETAAAVMRAANVENPWRVAFQSQGALAEPWLGPDLPETFAALRAAGARDVVIVAIGFLADHVEILYDLDVEARELATRAGLGFFRAASLDARPALVEALAAVARRAAQG
jgi:ferrochelatase